MAGGAETSQLEVSLWGQEATWIDTCPRAFSPIYDTEDPDTGEQNSDVALGRLGLRGSTPC